MSEHKGGLRAAYRRAAFFPGILGLFVNPFYFARKGLAQAIGELGSQITGDTLDIGCGSKPYIALYCSDKYVGLEIDTPQNRELKNADFFYDGVNFPFEDASFDSVVANQVFEHVFNPVHFLSEVSRILKPGGKMLMTVPFVWDEHEQPYDFARYSSFGLKALLEEQGFEIISHRKSTNDIRVIFQLVNAYIYKQTCTKNAWVNLLTTLVLMAPFNILGELFFRITPKNEDLYLDNIILTKWDRQSHV